MSLMDKLMKSGSVKSASILSESQFFTAKDKITTDLPVLNIAFTGEIDGGLISGLTLFAGESKSFKTLLGLYCLRAYLRKYPDAIALVYDSEFGITPEYLAANGIDTDRVLHVPVEHIEELKFDIVNRLNEIKRGDKVFVMIDSLGLGSKKELEDALSEKSVADMTRAKALRSLLRIITPMLTTKDIPCVGINHTYKTMEMFSKDVVGGGTAPIYFSNQIFIITKAQDSSGEGAKKVLNGFDFTIRVEKSRFVREKSKLSFNVNFDKGINLWSGMLDLALESGDAVVAKKGYYQLVDPETGECLGEPVKGAKRTENVEFLGTIMKRTKFRDFIKKKYKLGQGLLVQEDTSNDDFDDEDEE
jgi:RecA/RadA recombinase